MTFQALLFCPDEKTARVTTQVLTELEFSVEACTEPFGAVKKLMGQHFDAIVVDCDNEQNASLLFKSARNSTSNQASLAVAVVEGQSGVANAFRIGANLVLTKPINVEQAKSTLRVARGLLRKGGEAAKPAGNTSSLPTSANSPSSEKPVSASDPLPSASPISPRPTTPSTSVMKPSVPAIAALKAPPPPAVMTKNQPEVARGSEVQRPAPTTSASEPDLFEPSVASAPAVDQPTSSQQYPWQSALKAGGTSLQRPVAAEEKKEAAPAPKESSAAATTPTREARPAFTSSVLTSGGAASAPAPAREAPKPTIPTTAWEAEQAVAMVTAPTKVPEQSPARPVMRAAVSAAALTETPAPSAPTFSALDSSQEGSASAGSKKGILVAAVIIVLGVAGYFGYTKFYAGRHSAKSVAASQVPPATGENSTVEPSVPPLSAVAPSATVVATPLPATKSQPAPTPVGSSKPSSAEESDVTVSHPDTAPALVVKSGGSAKPAPKAEPANDIAAPSIGMNNDDQGAISNLVQSTTVAVPKVAVPQETLKVSQGVTQGLLTKRVQPVYPPQAMQMHIQGAVQMLATISKEGKITSVKVLNGDPILSRAATDAVSQWRYKPYFLNGQPVEIQTQIVVNFKLP
jgi:periplasmic protein TonB